MLRRNRQDCCRGTGFIVDEDEITLSKRKKRLRSEVTGECLSRPDVESYIKSVDGTFAKCFQSPQKNEVIQLADTAREMLEKSVVTHNQAMYALKEELNCVHGEYKKITNEALITSSKNIQLEKDEVVSPLPSTMGKI
ncbi:hypothetical protein JCGZ_10864 [Jatropha curcas]|uniref:Uncharacterized protein n=1 Tax=Jatropha curcas TaxID=180498 RepID=A0A067KGV3_JATCU|nr:hypothetical protein JCGZ_10864 [Jatropha curcas]